MCMAKHNGAHCARPVCAYRAVREVWTLLEPVPQVRARASNVSRLGAARPSISAVKTPTAWYSSISASCRGNSSSSSCSRRATRPRPRRSSPHPPLRSAAQRTANMSSPAAAWVSRGAVRKPANSTRCRDVRCRYQLRTCAGHRVSGARCRHAGYTAQPDSSTGRHQRCLPPQKSKRRPKSPKPRTKRLRIQRVVQIIPRRNAHLRNL